MLCCFPFLKSSNFIDYYDSVNRVWLIPREAKKPADGRLKINKMRNGDD